MSVLLQELADQGGTGMQIFSSDPLDKGAMPWQEALDILADRQTPYAYIYYKLTYEPSAQVS